MTRREEDILLYHNPRCSKSRQVLQLLDEHGMQARVVEYLKTPPNRSELEQLLKMLGLEPRQLMRTKDDLYRQLQLDREDISRDQLIQAMLEHPALIERPIVVQGNRAAIGRPPEKILEILK
jgi:arsenate reductase